MVIQKPLIHFTYVWENANWFLVFLTSLISLSFLTGGLTSAYFKPGEKEELDRELMKLWCMNRAMTSLFPLMIGTDMSLV